MTGQVKFGRRTFAPSDAVIARIDEQIDPRRKVAYERYKAELVKPRKARPAPDASDSLIGDDDETVFCRAVMIWHERDKIGPLAAYVASGRSLSAANRIALAGLLKLLDARSRPLAKGKPAGSWKRWQNPTYLAVWLIEKRLDAWKVEHGRRTVPAKVRDRFVDEMTRESKGWVSMRGRPRRDRILQLLREPKNRRL